MERVDYVTRDSIINIGGPTYIGNFWQIRKTLDRPKAKNVNETILLQTQIYLMPYKQEFFREIYNIRHVASDLGGMINACSLIALAMIYPLSRHFFYTNLINQLYFVKTNKDDLMRSPNS